MLSKPLTYFIVISNISLEQVLTNLTYKVLLLRKIHQELSMKIISLTKFILISILMSVGSNLYASPIPSYKGIPKKDVNFAKFLKKNHNKIVQLDLVIQDPDDFDFITYGYRSVSPTFDIAPIGKVKYDAYIECDKINNPNAETTIDKCAPYVQWNTETGHLTGKFKIISKGKNGMGSMLYYLIATK